MIAPLFLLISMMFTGGCIAIGLAWRSQHTGDHPICSRCGFDLHGQEPLARCPECGQEGMERGGGYYYGRRGHNRALMTLGIILVVVASIPIAIGVAAAIWYGVM